MSNSTLLDSYREYERDLLRFLMRRLRCAFTARDLAQDIFLKIGDVEDPDAVRNPKAYLFRMAANLATDHQRTEIRRAELIEEVHDLLWGGADTRTPERAAIAREEIGKVMRAAEQLPPLTREIFRLNRFEHRQQRDIAKHLGVSLTTVENHIRTALTILAKARDGEIRDGEK
jgi:RNA polymerase sigma-70 factor (ECF subfamily)